MRLLVRRRMDVLGVFLFLSVGIVIHTVVDETVHVTIRPHVTRTVAENDGARRAKIKPVYHYGIPVIISPLEYPFQDLS